MKSGLFRGLKALWQTGPLVILGLVCYFLSALLDNLWYDAKDLMWLDPEWMDIYSFKVKLYTMSNQIMRAIYAILLAVMVSAFLQFVPVKSFTYGGVLLASLIFWVLAIAETFAVFQYVLCKVVGDQLTTDALRLIYEMDPNTSACKRFAGPVMEWGPLTISTAAIAWILWRAWQVWRSQSPRHTDG